MPSEKISTDALLDIARAHLGTDARISTMREGSRVADGAMLLLAENANARLVVQLSQPTFPDFAAEGCDRARSFAEAIGAPLSGAVLLPIAQGRIDKRSFALLPWHKPLPEGRLRWWIARRRIRPALFDWLADIARLSRPGDATTYIRNLRALARFPKIGRDIVEDAEIGIELIEEGVIAPLHMPMHGDLWRGNILSGDGDRPFTLIDWRGSRVDGFPLFDLVRLAESLRLSPVRLAKELWRHEEMLGSPVRHGGTLLLAALGHYARNLGEMPPDSFRSMAQNCHLLHTLAAAIARQWPTRIRPKKAVEEYRNR